MPSGGDASVGEPIKARMIIKKGIFRLVIKTEAMPRDVSHTKTIAPAKAVRQLEPTSAKAVRYFNRGLLANPNQSEYQQNAVSSGS